MSIVNSIEQLESIYGSPTEAATVKVANYLTDDYRKIIKMSPFTVLATVGPEGLDCSPRGDFPGFVRIIGETGLQMPDRRGNNRIDSLRNIVRDPRAALLFFLPGCGNTLRVDTVAQVSVEPSLLESFAVDGKLPRSVISMKVKQIFFQCARAIIRSDLWNSERHVDPSTLPSAGEILAKLSGNRVGGETYDQQWPQRAQRTMW